MPTTTITLDIAYDINLFTLIQILEKFNSPKIISYNNLNPNPTLTLEFKSEIDLNSFILEINS